MYTNGSKEPKFSIIKPTYFFARDWTILGAGLFLAKAPKGVGPILSSKCYKFLVRSAPCQK